MTRTARVARDEGPIVGAASRTRRGRPGWARALLTSRVLWALVIVALFAVPALTVGLREQRAEPPTLVTLPRFEFESEQGAVFGSEELRGQVYAASFIFTSCPTVCPRIMQRMVELEQRTQHLGRRFRLVAFTVDPENDTPDVLRGYGRRFGADPARFTFLRGDIAAVQQVIVEGFKLAMGRDAKAEMGIFHSDRLVLVDRQGRVRGYYESTADGLDTLVRDAEAIVDAR